MNLTQLHGRVSGVRILACALERLRSSVAVSADIALHRSVRVLPAAGSQPAPVLLTNRAWLAFPRRGVRSWAFSLATGGPFPNEATAVGELIAFSLEPEEYLTPSGYEVGQAIVRRLEQSKQSPRIRYHASARGRITVPADGPAHIALGRMLDQRAQSVFVGNEMHTAYLRPPTACLIADAIHGILDL